MLQWINENSGLIQLAIVIGVLPFLNTLRRKAIERGANDDLLGALSRGADFALSALQTLGAGPITKATVIAAAIEYARRSQPEAFNTLRPTMEHLETVAAAQAEPVVRAATAAAAAAGLPLPVEPLTALADAAEPQRVAALVAAIMPPGPATLKG